MQSFETFETVFAFLIRSVLDKQYVDEIDTSVEHGTASSEVSELIGDVRAFHKMRQTLCVRVFRHFQKNNVLETLCRARGLIQYNFVPTGALCAITGTSLSHNQGAMFILNPNGDATPMVVHSRFKLLLYHFWYLVHFTDEIILDTRKWMRQQVWWRRGYRIDIAEVVRRVMLHGKGSFVKKHYVKLKGVSQHIQDTVAHGPINQTQTATV